MPLYQVRSFRSPSSTLCLRRCWNAKRRGKGTQDDDLVKEMVLTRDALGESGWGIGASTVRCTWMMFLAALLAGAAAMVVSATQPQAANATSTVSVTTCNGGTIQLNADEKRTLDLHNQTKPAPPTGSPVCARTPRSPTLPTLTPRRC